jgi:hypothetical protein
MQKDVKQAATTRESAEPQKFQKRIGSTVYRVTVHYSQTSEETIEDKLIRLMESEVRESA